MHIRRSQRKRNDRRGKTIIVFELAIREKLPLATLDQKLKKAAKIKGVSLIVK